MLIHASPETYKDNYDAIADVLGKNGLLKLNRGCEVGVRHGVFSQFLLEHCPELHLTLVDPYLPYQDVDYNYSAQEQEAYFQAARARLAHFGDRVHWMRESSVMAAATACWNFRPYDFVFVDAKHTYESVCADVRAWLPCIRAGGLLSGHDYNMEPVRRAVDEFAQGRGLDVQHVAWPAHVWLIEIPK